MGHYDSLLPMVTLGSTLALLILPGITVGYVVVGDVPWRLMGDHLSWGQKEDGYVGA